MFSKDHVLALRTKAPHLPERVLVLKRGPALRAEIQRGAMPLMRILAWYVVMIVSVIQCISRLIHPTSNPR
jgi:hypothetical protein